MAVDRDKVLQAAQKLVEKKRYDKAIIEYQKLVAEDPKDARTLLKIGDLYLKLEHYAEAIATYERVGQFYSMQGFALKAIAVYKQIREIIHKHVPHLEDRFGHIVPRLAEIYTQLGLTSDALAAYDEVATRLQRAGRDRDAIDIFKKVVDLDPQNPLPYLRLAEAFVRVRDLDSAVQRFGAASDILLRLERHDDALKVLERLLQHRPEGRYARTAAEVYLARGLPNDPMAALTKLQICFKENPKDLDTLGVLARAFDQLGQPAKAVEVLKEAARIAIELDKLDVFESFMGALQQRAPTDPMIAQLQAQAASRGAAAQPARPESEAPPSVQVVDDVELEDFEPESAEAPFALRPAQVDPGGRARPPARPPPSPRDPVARARAAMAQAENLRGSRNYAEAAQILAAIVSELPNAREVREKLCDILIEAGDQDGAIEQMLQFAQHLASLSDVEGAARLLDEILLLEPNQPDAMHMLGALGYAVPGAQAPSAPPPQAAPKSDAGLGYDPNAPLPSYDLEEIGAAEALSHRAPSLSPAAPMGQLDDPFAAEMPLPSFPMEEEATTFLTATSIPPDASAYQSGGYPIVSESSPISAPTPSRRPPGEVLDEDALDEVEFFASHGMFDEARGILEEQLLRLPGHPLLLEKQREVEMMAAGLSQEQPSGQRTLSAQPPIDEDRSFDIAASLDALDALDALEPGGPAQVDNQISVETVFEQFKAGVAAQVSQSDAATHYDLGVAYKEMGLLPDAISEFELASRDPHRDCVCQSMIGLIHMQMGDVDAAIDAFIRGLHAQERTTEQELALTYEIGSAYEMRENTEQALYYFQRVARTDPDYTDPRGDVGARIKQLEPAPKAAAARAVGAPLVLDDFDEAFDDLLGSGKLP